MKKVFLVIALLSSGCSSTQHTSGKQLTEQPVSNSSSHITTPNNFELSYSDTMKIIRGAAEAAPAGVKGNYTFKIKATGSKGTFVYLNTEVDYRDQRAVTVAIHPRIIHQLEKKYGSSPQDYFVNKSIKVIGEAQRIKINFRTPFGLSDRYYYQTHIIVTDMAQIEVLKPGSSLSAALSH
ncbi:hypothetical protein [Salinimonas chungwhensis]|uniref:hypothetical protein n=1 Tax=Salinimonas chungwhensis TaxID=265425 RepID=UPI00058F9397|nr:hypothetical protein [Salinimonas chungwhensis]